MFLEALRVHQRLLDHRGAAPLLPVSTWGNPDTGSAYDSCAEQVAGAGRVRLPDLQAGADNPRYDDHRVMRPPCLIPPIGDTGRLVQADLFPFPRRGRREHRHEHGPHEREDREQDRVDKQSPPQEAPTLSPPARRSVRRRRRHVLLADLDLRHGRMAARASPRRRRRTEPCRPLSGHSSGWARAAALRGLR